MNSCDNCRMKLTGDEKNNHLNKTLCDECYIDLILKKSRKAHYLECAHSFMLRLKPGFDNRRLLSMDESMADTAQNGLKKNKRL